MPLPPSGRAGRNGVASNKRTTPPGIYLLRPSAKETPASAAPVALRIVASASYAGLRIIPHKNSRCTDGPYVGWFTRDSRHCSARPAPSGRRFLTLGSFFEPDLLKK